MKRAAYVNSASLAGGLAGSAVGGYLGGNIVAPAVSGTRSRDCRTRALTCAAIGGAAEAKLAGDFAGEKGEVLG